MNEHSLTDSGAGDSAPEVVSVWRGLLAKAIQHPWLWRIIRQRGQALFASFARYYQSILALSRQRRRALLRSVGGSVASVALVLTLGTMPALADTITVDGTCTLVDAITAANSNATVNNCAHSGTVGADTIQLQVDTDLTAINNGYNGLPVVTSHITIEGNGNTIRRNGGGQYRLFEISNLGNLTVTNSTVSGGRTDDGGAFYNEGHLTIANSTISGNEADTYGGAIYNNGAVTVTNSVLNGNTADSGGAIYSRNLLLVANSTLYNNYANNYGGAIYNQSGTTTVINSTISGNGSPNGGGIMNKAVTKVYSSTITNNNAYDSTYGGGGISQSGGTLTLRNTIVSGNNAPVNEEIEYFDGTITSLGFNLLGNSDHTNAEAFGQTTPPWLHANDITATSNGNDPTALFDILNSILTDNGGPTKTHALFTNSPAKDAIPTGSLLRSGDSGAAQPANCTASASYDQRGVFRANGTTTGNACDIGAFEFGQSPTAVTIVGFSAATVWGNGPALNWETAEESGLAGFHIWRGSAEKAETRLTDALIGAAGGLNGNKYTWQDSATFTWGQHTHYWLEAVNGDGSSLFTGPVEVVGVGWLFLPSVGR